MNGFIYSLQIDVWFLCFGKDNWMIIVVVLKRLQPNLLTHMGVIVLPFAEEEDFPFTEDFIRKTRLIYLWTENELMF